MNNLIPYGRHHLDEDDIQSVLNCLREGSLTQGKRILEFEQAVAKYLNVSYAVSVSSGTAALHLAMLAGGITTDDAVITSPITFVASSNAILYVGARPVFVDVEPENLGFNQNALEKVTKNDRSIKAIVPVDYAGLSLCSTDLQSFCKQNDLLIIEDAAHSFGAEYDDGSKVGNGTRSDMTIFSFHPVKSIATGEGGMITTNNEEYYRKLLRLRSHGIIKGSDSYVNQAQSQTEGVDNLWYYEMQELGYNYRITDIQCALGISQLKKIDKFIERRRQLVARYDAVFKQDSTINLIQTSHRERSSHHLYPIRIDYTELNVSKAQLMQALRQKRFITQVHYIPVQMQPYYAGLGYRHEDTPEALRYYNETLSIPLYYDLKESEQDAFMESLFELIK